MPLPLLSFHKAGMPANISAESILQSSTAKRLTYQLYPVYYIENRTPVNFDLIQKLFTNFSDEFKKKHSYFIGYDPNQVIYYFATAASFVFQFNPDFAGVELTNSKSIFLSFKKEDVVIHLELFFENEINEPVEAVVNIYKIKEHQLSYAGSFPKTIKEIKNYFSPTVAEDYYKKNIYAVSSATATEYAI